MTNLYLVEYGVLLDKGDKGYEAYASYDKQYGFYDEDQYLTKDLKGAIREAHAYVEKGVVGTYAVITDQGLFKDDISDEDIRKRDVSGLDYSADAVVYSIKKDTDGTIEKDFIVKAGK